MTWFKKDASFLWFNALTVTPEEVSRVMSYELLSRGDGNL
jgi:hypothetical protein